MDNLDEEESLVKAFLKFLAVAAVIIILAYLRHQRKEARHADQLREFDATAEKIAAKNRKKEAQSLTAPAPADPNATQIPSPTPL